MLSDEIAEWMTMELNNLQVDGAVLGLSGGVDSAVAAGLLSKAVQPHAVITLLLPCEGSSPKDAHYAQLTADTFNLRLVTIDLRRPFEGLAQSFSRPDIPRKDREYWPKSDIEISDPEKDFALENIKPRLRMLTMYYVAERMNYAVIGTSNKTELLSGYYTKYGDNAADIKPMASLLKTQVWELARELGVPREIISRPPSAGFHEGQTDEEELGVSYETLDKIYGDISNPIEQHEGIELQDIKRAQSLQRAAKRKSKVAIFED